MDLAPTCLETAGLRPLTEMTGKSFFGLLTGAEQFGSRDVVFLERERHANVRVGSTGYPTRAIRTRDFLYIRNFRPERWPVGDPQAYKDPDQPFGDCDDGPAKGTSWTIVTSLGCKLTSSSVLQAPRGGAL